MYLQISSTDVKKQAKTSFTSMGIKRYCPSRPYGNHPTGETVLASLREQECCRDAIDSNSLVVQKDGRPAASPEVTGRHLRGYPPPRVGSCVDRALVTALWKHQNVIG